MQETLLYCLEDPEAANLKTEKEAVEHIKYRFKMLSFRTIRDHNEEMKNYFRPTPEQDEEEELNN